MYESLKRELSYIQGLLEGDSSHQHHVEYKGLNRLVDIIDQMIEANEQLARRLTELEEYVEAIDEDLNDVELLTYGEDGDEEMVEVVCPDCGEEVLIDEDDLEDDSVELLCPKCHTLLELEDVNEEEVGDLIGAAEEK
ncbi:MAG: CD1247 N-terminal domain-containing protein [Thermoactinomyces sp.]|jgi:formylmethanofuran dehydrogenase subunit E